MSLLAHMPNVVEESVLQRRSTAGGMKSDIRARIITRFLYYSKIRGKQTTEMSVFLLRQCEGAGGGTDVLNGRLLFR